MHKSRILLAGMVLLLAIVACSCAPLEFGSAEKCVALYHAFSEEFQTAAAALIENYEEDIGVVRSTQYISSRYIIYQIDDLYYLSQQPLQEATYQALHEAVAPLFRQTSLETIGVGDGGIGFVLEFEYGTMSELYYHPAGELPKQGLQSVLERTRIDDCWSAVVEQD